MTISMPIEVQDRLTIPFRSMTNAVEAMVRQFEVLQSDLSQSPNLQYIDTIKNELAVATRHFDDISTHTQSATRSQREYNDVVTQGNDRILNLASGVRSMVGAYLGFRAVKSMIGLSDQLSSNTARLDNMNDGLQTTADLQKMILKSANETRGSYTDMIDTVAKLGTLAGGAFKNTAEIVAFSKLMNESFQASGASLQEQKNGMYQLTQAMASGRLQGDEFRSILENAPMFAQAIKKELNGIDLKKASSEGLITSDIIKRAMFKSADDIKRKFNEMPLTFGGAMQILKNNFIMGMDPILKSLNKLVNNPYIKDFVNNSIVWFSIFANAFVGSINLINELITFLGNNMDWLLPILGALVSGFLLYKGAIIATTTAKSILSAVETAHNGVMVAWKIATGQMTLAQWGLNSALYACPIVWIIALVIGLIAVIFIVIAAINKVKGTSISAVGVIIGSLYALGTIILNILKSIANRFITVIQFIVNGFIGGINKIKNLFISLGQLTIGIARGMIGAFNSVATALANAFISGVNGAIGALNVLIDGINHIPGMNISHIGTMAHIKTSFGSGLDSKLASMEKMLSSEKDDNISEFKIRKFEYGDIGDSYKKGYSVGKGLGQSVKNQIDSLKKEFNIGQKLDEITKNLQNGNLAEDSKGLGGAGKHAKDTAKNTKKIADNTEATIDDIRYLRELTEREAINRYTTASINIDMYNQNTISKDVDLDGIVDRLGEKVQERLSISTDGHYSLA